MGNAIRAVASTVEKVATVAGQVATVAGKVAGALGPLVAVGGKNVTNDELIVLVEMKYYISQTCGPLASLQGYTKTIEGSGVSSDDVKLPLQWTYLFVTLLNTYVSYLNGYIYLLSQRNWESNDEAKLKTATSEFLIIYATFVEFCSTVNNYSVALPQVAKLILLNGTVFPSQGPLDVAPESPPQFTFDNFKTFDLSTVCQNSNSEIAFMLDSSQNVTDSSLRDKQYMFSDEEKISKVVILGLDVVLEGNTVGELQDSPSFYKATWSGTTCSYGSRKLTFSSNPTHSREMVGTGTLQGQPNYNIFYMKEV